MEELKLHSFGQNDHLETLKKKYASLRKRIIRNGKLSETEKNAELKTLKKSFEKEKTETKNNLY